MRFSRPTTAGYGDGYNIIGLLILCIRTPVSREAIFAAYNLPLRARARALPTNRYGLNQRVKTLLKRFETQWQLRFVATD